MAMAMAMAIAMAMAMAMAMAIAMAMAMAIRRLLKRWNSNAFLSVGIPTLKKALEFQGLSKCRIAMAMAMAMAKMPFVSIVFKIIVRFRRRGDGGGRPDLPSLVAPETVQFSRVLTNFQLSKTGLPCRGKNPGKNTYFNEFPIVQDWAPLQGQKS